MQASKDERQKLEVMTDVQQAQLFGQAQKNVNLMKEILKTTQTQLDKIYTSLAAAKKAEKEKILQAESIPAPVAEVSVESVAALSDIHSSVSEYNDQAKKVEAKLQLLVHNYDDSTLDFKSELQANLDFLNHQNEALKKLQEKLARLAMITGKVSFKSVSKKQLGKMIARVNNQLQDLSIRNRALKESLMMNSQLKTSVANDKNAEPVENKTPRTFKK